MCGGMRILIVTQYFWPESFRINDIAQGLVELGHEVVVLTGKPNYPAGVFYPGYSFFGQTEEDLGPIKIYRVPLIPRGKKKGLQLILNYLSFAFFASIKGIFKAKGADVVLVYEPSPITVGIPAIVIKKFLKVPILFWVQDLWPETLTAVNIIRSKRILGWVRALVKMIYSQSDYILTTSRAYFDPILKLDVSKDKLRYFPQTAESIYQSLDRSECEKEDALFPKGFRVLFSGNIGIAQDVGNILEAAILLKDHPEIKWIFLGDGSKREWLEAQIKEQGLENTVYWLGQHPVSSMSKFYACSDVLLVSLKKDPLFALTIPAKIQSYLVCKKPIIAALDGEGANIIQEANAGLAVESGNPKLLADAVLEMKSLSQDQLDELGSNGHRYYESHFQRDNLLNQLNDWMIELKGQAI